MNAQPAFCGMQTQVKRLLKKKHFEFYYHQDPTGFDGAYKRQDSFDYGHQKRIDFERKINERGFLSGMFQFDLYAILNQSEELNNTLHREEILMKLQEFIFKIYNITLRPLNSF